MLTLSRRKEVEHKHTRIRFILSYQGLTSVMVVLYRPVRRKFTRFERGLELGLG